MIEWKFFTKLRKRTPPWTESKILCFVCTHIDGFDRFLFFVNFFLLFRFVYGFGFSNLAHFIDFISKNHFLIIHYVINFSFFFTENWKSRGYEICQYAMPHFLVWTLDAGCCSLIMIFGNLLMEYHMWTRKDGKQLDRTCSTQCEWAARYELTQWLYLFSSWTVCMMKEYVWLLFCWTIKLWFPLFFATFHESIPLKLFHAKAHIHSFISSFSFSGYFFFLLSFGH